MRDDLACVPPKHLHRKLIRALVLYNFFLSVSLGRSVRKQTVKEGTRESEASYHKQIIVFTPTEKKFVLRSSQIYTNMFYCCYLTTKYFLELRLHFHFYEFSFCKKIRDKRKSTIRN